MPLEQYAGSRQQHMIRNLLPEEDALEDTDDEEADPPFLVTSGSSPNRIRF